MTLPDDSLFTGQRMLRRDPRSCSRGVALVIVLAMLVLLSGIVVAFFSSVTNESTASSLATGSLQAQQLADTTTNLVMSQIRDATSQTDLTVPGQIGFAWASQPGAIRTFRGPGQTGSVYKLYSSDKMIQLESEYVPSQQADPANDIPGESYWPTSASDIRYGFADLNEPLMGRDNEPIYPVINPTAKLRLDGTEGQNPLVEGFFCPNFTIAIQDRDTNGTRDVNVLPMPVKWLYVLRDGAIGTLEELMLAPEERRPSRLNPVVGRTAFWADDDSAKLNINTASEPTFWDTPYTSTLHEIGDISPGSFNVITGLGSSGSLASLNLSVSQPIQGEYQRYPGHPATTSLSPVLRNLFLTGAPGGSGLPITRPDNVYKDYIYQLAPRIYSDASLLPNWVNDLSTKAGTKVAPAIRPNVAADDILPDDNDRVGSPGTELEFAL